MFSSSLSREYQDRERADNLTRQFEDYLSKVREFKTSKEGITYDGSYLCQIKLLEDEIIALKNNYENDLEILRRNLDNREQTMLELKSRVERDALEIEQNQIRLRQEIQHRKDKEQENLHLKTTIMEKDSLLKDAYGCIEAQKLRERDFESDNDTLLLKLRQAKTMADDDSQKVRELQMTLEQVETRKDLDKDSWTKELLDSKNQLHLAQHTITTLDEALNGRQNVDSKLHIIVEELQKKSEIEVLQLRENLAIEHGRVIGQLKTDLADKDNTIQKLNHFEINSKAEIERLQENLNGWQAKCNSIEDKFSSLQITTNHERQENENVIQKLENRIRDLQEEIALKNNELEAINSARIPVNMKMDALAMMIEEERRRLDVTKSPTTFCPLLTSSTITTQKRLTPTTRASTSLGFRHQRSKTDSALWTTRPRSTPPTTLLPMKSSYHRPETWSNNSQSFLRSTSPLRSISAEHVRIQEVDTLGHFIRLFNTSTVQDIDIGGYTLQQSVQGRPITVYRFPPRTVIGRCDHLTVWSACSKKRPTSPTDLVWTNQHKWGTGSHCLTVLCNHSGQAISWTDKHLGNEVSVYRQQQKDDQKKEQGTTVDFETPVKLERNEVKHPSSDVRFFPQTNHNISGNQISNERIKKSLGRPMPKTYGTNVSF